MYTLKLLIVDDEPRIRMGMKQILKNFKLVLPDVDSDIVLDIDMAENGTQTLEKVRNNKPDIMLLDYKLPDMTGLEALEELQLKEDELVTIMITAYATLDTAVSAIKSGAFDFLAKPFTPKELRATVSKAAQSLILARHVKLLNEEKRQVRFQFISILGHELKAPLAAVQSFLDLIQEETLGNELINYKDILNKCNVRLDQMRKLIFDLLEMTKIESGKRQREFKIIDIYETVKTSIETMQLDANKRNISINLYCKSPLMFVADKQEIEIVLNNLISNAVKYNRDNGKADINIVKEENKLIIKVSDTGIGMSQEETAKLFQEFVRIKNNKTKNILGSGLGLSTVKKIALLYNGDATVDSIEDQGTSFTVTLLENTREDNK